MIFSTFLKKIHFILVFFCGGTSFVFELTFVGSSPYFLFHYQKNIFFWFFCLFCSFFLSPFLFRFLVNFTDTFFTLDVYLGHGDAVRVVDPESGKLERQNVEHENSHGLSLNTPILGTTSTSTRRHTRRESKDGMLIIFNFFKCFNVYNKCLCLLF
jgi:hypothetical protein